MADGAERNSTFPQDFVLRSIPECIDSTVLAVQLERGHKPSPVLDTGPYLKLGERVKIVAYVEEFHGRTSRLLEEMR